MQGVSSLKLPEKWQDTSLADLGDAKETQIGEESAGLRRAGSLIASLERELSEARRTLEIVLDAVTGCVEIIDRNFRIVAANQASAAFWGLPLGNLVGKHCYAIHAGRTRPCKNCPTAEAFRSGKSVTAIHRRSRWDGKIVRRRTTAYPLTDEHGRVIRTINFSMDTGKHVQQETTTLQSARLSAVAELATGVAHEINNPLTAIIGNAQLLLRDLDMDDPNYAAARTIERAGLRAKAIVQHLLRFSRQEEYSFQHTDINASIRNALSAVSQQFQQAGIRVVAELAADLPPIWASASHLENAWVNLLLNARDALMRAGERREVHIVSSLSSDGRCIRVLIRDTGCGIPPEHLGRLFEPFFTTKEPNEGAGLGLYACYEIIAAHNGTIQVESQPGEGATFCISLPVR